MNYHCDKLDLRNKHCAAFTLTELLVVLSIIGVLAALLLPTLQKVQAQSRFAKCTSNLKQLGAAEILYINDHNGALPLNIAAPINNPTGNTTWMESVAAYMNLTFDSLGRLVGPGVRPPSVFACPESRNLSTGGSRGDYAMNYQMDGGDSAARTWTIQRISLASKTMALVESGSPPGTVNGTCVRDAGPWLTPTGGLVARHNGKCNVLYYDWHVEAIDPTTVQLTNGTIVPWQPNVLGN